MQAIADRPVDVLRAQGQGIGPGTRTGPGSVFATITLFIFGRQNIRI